MNKKQEIFFEPIFFLIQYPPLSNRFLHKMLSFKKRRNNYICFAFMFIFVRASLLEDIILFKSNFDNLPSSRAKVYQGKSSNYQIMHMFAISSHPALIVTCPIPMVPFKAWSDQVWIRFPCFCLWKHTFSFAEK